jgi:Xaa-Pro aminopeptidase
MRDAILAMLISLMALPAFAEPALLPMRERAELIDRWLDVRIDTVLPELMRRTGIDMWIIVSREYNEDPVIRTFLPSKWQSARRTTILMIHDPGGDTALETLAVARYNVGERFIKAWDKEEDGEQWAHLARLIEERDPDRIGLNVSTTFALADGISHTEYRQFHAALPEHLHERVVSAEDLAIGWLETRTPDEMVVYPQIVRIAHDIIAEGFSERVIQPGVTTTADVEWWYRDRVRELRLTTWFHPSVDVDRPGQAEEDMKSSIASRFEEEIIQPGDLLHVDFGIHYLRLNTDTQQHAYVLKPGETDAPEELKDALAAGNRLQDILTEQFVAGRTGNEILEKALDKAESEGITASIYTHPIGFHGHAAGPTIGLWDQQDGVPGPGDYPLYPNTAYSIELYAESEIPSWNKPVRIRLEEDAFFDGERTVYIDGRQREFLLIPRQPALQ